MMPRHLAYADALESQVKQRPGAGMSQAQANALGIKVTTYYKHKRDGLTHDGAIKAALVSAANGTAHKRGNGHDNSIAEVSKLLRGWKR